MKPGRPCCHIKAKWIAWCQNGESTFYELDEKGNLIKSSDSDFIHYSNRTESKNNKKKRTKRKNEVPKPESPIEMVQESIQELNVDNNLNGVLPNSPFENFIEDNNAFDFFQLLDHLNDDTTLFDQLFEF
ncbi:hypothetical protein M9Y10_028533 [Tritrichomonas musculus]|uniref:Uncharacterized protein n=1 Tax=Tritrichomonas musculus TaxID=1915356 RepID=A0ABR2KJL0_9EUKA